ncbi:hypothetical protein D8674_001239 [Pyrus ussuriensis x Pyrus communis]|uniref:Uncharacterized protein n=1 Tax=Pyrus ussuriensis x Pyrus communis TaxID=2448454 RepID=A0A5N5F5I5_9ROSA|nr:hypothetical protein D8674_001239 [Pyrus ussuriensis x Pyrus communis]
MCVFCKEASQYVVWTKENEDGALENFKSQKRERYIFCDLFVRSYGYLGMNWQKIVQTMMKQSREC